MTCRQVRTLADEMAEGKIEPELEARARAHAVDCEDCATVLERAVALRQLLDAARQDLAPPPDFVATVRQRILDGGVRPRAASAIAGLLRLPALRSAALAGVAALLVFAVVRASGPGAPLAPGSESDVISVEAVAQAGLAPEVADALENAAASNEGEEPLFADMGVVEIARAQASDAATSCLDM